MFYWRRQIKNIIADESSTEKSESECVQKIWNKEKDTNNKAEYEEHSVTYDPVVREPSYFNKFEYENNDLNKIYATCKRPCMATPREKYYIYIYETLIDYNERNYAPFSNENIQQAINKVISEEESDAYKKLQMPIM